MSVIGFCVIALVVTALYSCSRSARQKRSLQARRDRREASVEDAGGRCRVLDALTHLVGAIPRTDLEDLLDAWARAEIAAHQCAALLRSASVARVDVTTVRLADTTTPSTNLVRERFAAWSAECSRRKAAFEERTREIEELIRLYAERAAMELAAVPRA